MSLILTIIIVSTFWMCHFRLRRLKTKRNNKWHLFCFSHKQLFSSLKTFSLLLFVCVNESFFVISSCYRRCCCSFLLVLHVAFRTTIGKIKDFQFRILLVLIVVLRFGALSDNKCLALDLSSWPVASRKVIKRYA